MANGQVWDVFLRLFHWLLVAAFCTSWLTAELGVEYREIHFYSGYTALGLIIFRLCWGVVGSAYARFGHFLRGPRAVVSYLRARLRQEPPPETYPGHNPLGGFAVLALLVLMAAQAITGLFADDDILYTGPWREAVTSSTADEFTEWHHRLFDGLLVLVGLHVAAIGVYRLAFKEALVAPMLTGKKGLTAFGQFPPLQGTPWVRGIVGIAVAAGCVWLMLYLAPEPDLSDFYY